MASDEVIVGESALPEASTSAGSAPTAPAQSWPGLLSDTPVLDALLPVLSPDAIFRLGATCRALYNPVKSYAVRTFNGDGLLGRFFDDVAGFRAVLARTGAIVSGSTALQVLDRVRYKESDLDVYVLPPYARELCDWILGQGYYVEMMWARPDAPLEVQVSLLYNQLDDLVEDWRRGDRRPEFSVDVLLDYEHGIRVFTFTKEGARVQVIVSNCDVFASVLNFHSTVVLNILTHRAVYSLYPLFTFRDRQSLILHRVGESLRDPRIRDVITKYRGRGFVFVTSAGQSGPLLVGPRTVGDARTWTAPQPMAELERLLRRDGIAEVPPDAIAGRRWELVPSRNRPMLSARVLDGESFEVEHE